MTQSIIKVRGLSKNYSVREPRGLFRSTKRTIPALKDVTFDVHQGEIFGLLGPNGAGKTTLIKCLTTLLLPSSGSAWINGYDLIRQDEKVRASIGCMLMGERGLYWKLTGRENLLYFAALYYIPFRERHKRVNALIARLNMGKFIDRPVESYSSGQKMKLAFTKTLLNNAPILILDEPTNTLDVHSARELRAIVKEFHKEGHTIIYTSHLMSEVEELCSRIAIVNHGQIIAIGSLQDIKQQIKQPRVISIRGLFPPHILSLLHDLPAVETIHLHRYDLYQELVVVSTLLKQTFPDLLQILMQADSFIEDIQTDTITLEDAFVYITRQDQEKGSLQQEVVYP